MKKCKTPGGVTNTPRHVKDGNCEESTGGHTPENELAEYILLAGKTYQPDLLETFIEVGAGYSYTL